jgi:hypothetical protein
MRRKRSIGSEAATLPSETCRDGVFNVKDYTIESNQVGTIEEVGTDD